MLHRLDKNTNEAIVSSHYSINISTTNKEPMVKKEINFSIYWYTSVTFAINYLSSLISYMRHKHVFFKELVSL